VGGLNDRKRGSANVRHHSYLLVLPRPGKSLKPLKSLFHELGGFYNGCGYAFPLYVESELEKLLLPLKISILHQPLKEGESFQTLKQAHKAAFFQEQLLRQEMHLLELKEQLKIEEIDEHIVQTAPLSEEQKQSALELLNRCEDLRSSIAWAEGMEKALAISPQSLVQIKCLNEYDQHFLIDPPPDMPRLVNILENQIPRPFLRKGILGMVVGAGGVGKTHFLTQLGLCIATGIPFLETYPIEKPGHVFIGLGENAEEDIHRLFHKIFHRLFHAKQPLLKEAIELQTISQRISISSFTGIHAAFIHKGAPTPLFYSLFNQLKEKEPEEGWSCIILDPISRFLGEEAETDNAAATQFISTLEKLTLELKGKPTVLFGHHMNKSGISGVNTDQSAARGSSALTDGVRLQINLERVKKEKPTDPDQILMKTVKTNFTHYPPDQTLIKDGSGYLHPFQNKPKLLKNDLLKSLGIAGIGLDHDPL